MYMQFITIITIMCADMQIWTTSNYLPSWKRNVMTRACGDLVLTQKETWERLSGSYQGLDSSLFPPPIPVPTLQTSPMYDNFEVTSLTPGWQTGKALFLQLGCCERWQRAEGTVRIPMTQKQSQLTTYMQQINHPDAFTSCSNLRQQQQ